MDSTPEEIARRRKAFYDRKRAELIITYLYDMDCNHTPTHFSILQKKPKDLTYVESDEERPSIYLSSNGISHFEVSRVPFTPDCINPDLLLDIQTAGEIDMLEQVYQTSIEKFHKLLQSEKKKKKRFFKVRKLRARYREYLAASLLIDEEEEEMTKIRERRLGSTRVEGKFE